MDRPDALETPWPTIQMSPTCVEEDRMGVRNISFFWNKGNALIRVPTSGF